MTCAVLSVLKETADSGQADDALTPIPRGTGGGPPAVPPLEAPICSVLVLKAVPLALPTAEVLHAVSYADFLPVDVSQCWTMPVGPDLQHIFIKFESPVQASSHQTYLDRSFWQGVYSQAALLMPYPIVSLCAAVPPGVSAWPPRPSSTLVPPSTLSAAQTASSRSVSAPAWLPDAGAGQQTPVSVATTSVDVGPGPAAGFSRLAQVWSEQAADMASASTDPASNAPADVGVRPLSLPPWLVEREAFHPDTGVPHRDLAPVSDEFMALWKGTLHTSLRQHVPYVVVAANPVAEAIVDIHPNDLLDFIRQLVDQQSPLTLVGLWGTHPTTRNGDPAPPTFRQIFVGFASQADAQQFKTRFDAWDFDWTKFPIYRRCGPHYRRAPDGADPAADPFLKETPILVKALTAEIGDPRPPVKSEFGSGSGRSGSAAGLSDSRPAQRPRIDRPDPAMAQLQGLLAAHPHLLNQLSRR